MDSKLMDVCQLRSEIDLGYDFIKKFLKDYSENNATEKYAKKACDVSLDMGKRIIRLADICVDKLNEIKDSAGDEESSLEAKLIVAYYKNAKKKTDEAMKEMYDFIKKIKSEMEGTSQ